MSILYAGGGLKMGQAIGTTSAMAEYPTSKPYTPGCVLSTMYHILGIDHAHAFYDQRQRAAPDLERGRADQGIDWLILRSNGNNGETADALIASHRFSSLRRGIGIRTLGSSPCGSASNQRPSSSLPLGPKL